MHEKNKKCMISTAFEILTAVWLENNLPQLCDDSSRVETKPSVTM